MSTYPYLHTPAEIAAGLRAIADRLDAAPPAVFPNVAVSVNLQVCAWSTADVTARVAALDALSLATTGAPGRTHRLSDGTWMHGLPDSPDVAGVEIRIFGSIPDPVHAELRSAA